MEKKWELYKFKIDVYTPDTLPMARCASYLTELANILGETSSVHFVKVMPGTTQLVHKIDIEAVPKIKERTAAVKNGIGTVNQMQAYRRVNTMLREDNGSGAYMKGKSKLLSFPGKKKDIPRFTPIQQVGEIDGEVIRIGGSKEMVHITLSSEGNETSGINTKRSIAKELGKHLFEQVRLFGNGRWERDIDGVWNLIGFTVDRFEVLEEIPLSQTVLALRGLKGEWKKDVISEILESRHSEKDVN
jgi:hypothetical protein